MRYQDYIAEETVKAADEAFRYAKAVPADKLDWKPAETSRSVLDQAREIAKAPDWAYELVLGNDLKFDEESQAVEGAEMSSWLTIDDCYAACKEKLAKLLDLYKEVSDERLTETKWLPFDGGRDFTVAEMMDYPRWNFNYHVGAIAYIQTLYGDKEMH